MEQDAGQGTEPGAGGGGPGRLGPAPEDGSGGEPGARSTAPTREDATGPGDAGTAPAGGSAIPGGTAGGTRGGGSGRQAAAPPLAVFAYTAADEEKQRGVRRMKATATGLLLFVALVYVLATWAKN